MKKTHNPKPRNSVSWTVVGMAVGLLVGGVVGPVVDNPLVLVGGGLFLGFTIGMDIDNRRRENEL